MEKEADGKVRASYAFNWQTGGFEINYDYYIRINFGKVDELEILTQEEFDEYLMTLRKERGIIN